MNKFKIGDAVKFKPAWAGQTDKMKTSLDLYYTQTICKVMPDGAEVKVLGDDDWWDCNYWETVEDWAKHQVKAPTEVELSLKKLQIEGLQELKASHESTLKESYSALLWLYRRLPRCYESPPHIEAAIKNLAKALGEDAQEFIDERKGMK